MLLHFLVVGACNSVDPGPAVLGRRLSGERNGDYGGPIGEEIGYRNRHYCCFFYTARSVRI